MSRRQPPRKVRCQLVTHECGGLSLEVNRARMMRAIARTSSNLPTVKMAPKQRPRWATNALFFLCGVGPSWMLIDALFVEVSTRCDRRSRGRIRLVVRRRDTRLRVRGHRRI